MIAERLQAGGFTIIDHGLKEMWNPDEQSLAKCEAFGKEFGTQVK
jgi:flavorubredoxin